MESANATYVDTTYTFTTKEIHEILFILFCIIGVGCNAITIYAVLRFKKLQSANNLYLANWALVDIASLIITPTAFSIIAGFEHISTRAGFTLGCIKVRILLHSATIVAMLMIAFEWSLAAYFPNASEVFQKHTKSIAIVFWILIGICSTISLSVCDTYQLCVVDETVLLVCFGCLVLYVLILNVCRIVQKCRGNPLQYCALSLNIGTVFAITWTVGFYNLSHIRWSFNYPLLSLIMDCATFSSPIVNFVALYRYNTGFKECVRKVFKKSEKQVDNYYQFRNPIVINKHLVNDYSINIPKEQLLVN